MYEIRLRGALTSKRAWHVPVIRNWRVVWERREFGIQVDRIDRTIPLHFDVWEAIPESGLQVRIAGDFAVLIKRQLGNDGSKLVTVSALYRSLPIPGTVQTFPIPVFSESKLLTWNSEIFKGVRINVEATLSDVP